MIGLRRTWLLWRAHRLRVRADRLADLAHDEVVRLRQEADKCEREAADIARGLSP